MFKEIEYLANDTFIDLAVLWLTGQSDVNEEKRRTWINQIVSKWCWQNWVIYPLQLDAFGRVGKLISKIWKELVILKVLLLWKPEVIHAHISLLSRLFSFKRCFGFRFIVDLHGAGPEEGMFSGVTHDILQDLQRIEAKCVSTSDTIICVSDQMTKHLKTKYAVASDRFEVVPCCIHEREIDLVRAKRFVIREQMGWAEKTIMVYAGGTARYQCVTQMCQIFSEVSNRLMNTLLLILTWGNISEFIVELKRLKIASDRYLIMRVPQKDVHDYLTACDVALVLRENLLLNKVSCPTKIAEYLAAGLPLIITPYVGDAPAWVLNHRLGIVTELPPKADINALINFLITIPTEQNNYAQRCREFAKTHLTWESCLRSLHRAYGISW
jgi:glycosyltransferase involved in cell wall biosynthesis